MLAHRPVPTESCCPIRAVGQHTPLRHSQDEDRKNLAPTVIMLFKV
jgi:hypothetical protein